MMDMRCSMIQNLLFCIFLTLIYESGVYCQSPRVDDYQFNQNNRKSDIDLKGELGPIRNQGNMGFCYAHAAADVLSYWLNTKEEFKGTKKDTRQPDNMVSGLGMALYFNSMSERQEILDAMKIESSTVRLVKNGNVKPEGLLKDAEKKVDDYKKQLDQIEQQDSAMHQACEKNRDMQKKYHIEMDFTNEDWMDIYDKCAKLQEKNKEYVKAEKLRSAADEHYMRLIKLDNVGFEYKEPEGGSLFIPQKICFEKDVRSAAYVGEDDSFKKSLRSFFIDLYSIKNNPSDKKDLVSIVNKMFPNIRKKYVESQLKKFIKNDNNDALSKFTNKSCPDITKVVKNSFNCETQSASLFFSTSGDVEKLFKAIDKKLENKEIVFIGYNALVYFYDTETLKNNPFSYMSNGHASTIVGRAYDFATNEMWYIIRNSWGSDSCEKNYKEFIMSSPAFRDKLIEAAKDAYVTDPVRNQSITPDQMLDKLYKQYDMSKDQYKTSVPFRCDDGYYVVKKSHLAAGLHEVSYYIKYNTVSKKHSRPHEQYNCNHYSEY